jgi:hypothetical protein
MGFLNKIFGGEKKEYPSLDSANPLAQQFENFRSGIEGLAKDVNDPMEVIPSSDTAYVFLGKPPKAFGIAWIKDGKVNNFRTLSEEKGFTDMKLQLMSEKLRKAYEKSEGASRFITKISDHDIVVTSSNELERELRNIIEQ